MGGSLDKFFHKDMEVEEDGHTAINEFEFHGPFAEDLTNGLTFNDCYIPEEILLHIFTFIEAKQVLALSLVCRRWCNLIKSDQYWRDKYHAVCGEKPEKFPWYVYYCYLTTNNFKNLLKNPNGANQFEHWHRIQGSDGIKIECPPVGSDPLPKEPEFANDQHCFVTSYMKCSMIQTINLQYKRLLRFILRQYKFPILFSDWTAGRFDCSSVYSLGGRLESMEKGERPVENVHKVHEELLMDPIDRVKWRKVELLFTDYPDDLGKIIFIRYGKDKQFWQGNYGSKMSGGCVKFLLNDVYFAGSS